MKAYIAGKITGNPNYKAEFTAAEAELRKDHPSIDVILNPTILPEGMEPADYMRICFAMIDVADVVIFLPGWEESLGARLERAYCEYTGRATRELSRPYLHGRRF